MATLLTVLYIIVGAGFVLFPPTVHRHEYNMLVMSFSMAWGLGIGSVTVFWFPFFSYGIHVGMYVGAVAGGLLGRRGGPLHMLNGLLSGLMGGMMGAMLVYMLPDAHQMSAIMVLTLFNAGVLSLLVYAIRKRTS